MNFALNSSYITITGLLGNSKFCFTSTLDVFLDFVSRNIEISRENKTNCFPRDK